MNMNDILKKYRKPSKKGFSLVELIVVVCIVSIVSAATLSVFLMVQDVTRDASKMTIEQYNTTQMERLIRNELQVASNIDITNKTTFKKVGGIFPSGAKVEKDDEYMIYDEALGKITFMRADENLDFKAVFSITDIKEVSFTIAPLSDSLAEASQKVPYKIFYTITTSKYDYNGGMMLSNTVVKGSGGGAATQDKSWSYATTLFGNTQKTLKWTKDSADNSYVICFHRNVTEVATTP